MEHNPRARWKLLAKRVAAEAKADQVTLLAAGVAFYWLLALVPTLVAGISIYGLIADTEQIRRQVTSVTKGLPPDARNLIVNQLLELASTQSRSGLGIGSAVAVLLALWSASAGIRHLVEALNAATERVETRSFLRLRVGAYLLTLGAIFFAVVAAGFLAVLPSVLQHTKLQSTTQFWMNVVRFPLLAGMMLLGVSVVYHYGPNLRLTRWRWVTWGSAMATVVWILGSGLFALYTAYLGNFNRVYGSLGAVVVLMLWLLITALAILLGAELDDEIEKLQTEERVAQALLGDDDPGEPSAQGAGVSKRARNSSRT
jgi:membrane protein